MKNKLSIPILIIVLLLAGCSEKTDEEIFYDAQKKIVSIETYICTADITVYGNKSPQEYTVKQWFKAPDKCRIEIQGPDSIKGKTTIYNGKRAWISNPQIGQEWLMEKFSASMEQKMFLGYFINNFLNTENPTIKRKSIKDKDYIIMETEIPGNHPYFNKEKLWFDMKEYYPYRLKVFDVEDNPRIDVKFLNFSYNESIDDKVFNIR